MPYPSGCAYTVTVVRRGPGRAGTGSIKNRQFQGHLTFRAPYFHINKESVYSASGKESQPLKAGFLVADCPEGARWVSVHTPPLHSPWSSRALRSQAPWSLLTDGGNVLQNQMLVTSKCQGMKNHSTFPTEWAYAVYCRTDGHSITS